MARQLTEVLVALGSADLLLLSKEVQLQNLPPRIKENHDGFLKSNPKLNQDSICQSMRQNTSSPNLSIFGGGSQEK